MTPLFARLEVIDDPRPRAAAFNMAADEALLAHLADTPLLRVYRWQRPAISFGYFDHAEPGLLAFPGHDFVRRWTGGGVVEHGQDFTYSLLIPRTHALTAARARDSYRVLHEAVARALSAAGTALPTMLDTRTMPAVSGRSRACFVNAVQHDLLLADHKIAGAAQRRTRRGWLHQGSIRLTAGAEETYERLRKTLPAVLSADTRGRAMNPVEEAAADALTLNKYGTDAWLRRV